MTVSVLYALTIAGGERKQTVVIAGETMTTTGSPVQTPQGAIIPINEWKRVK